MAHYDPRGQVAPHVRRNIEELAGFAHRMIVVSTAELEPASEAWLRERVTLLRRENYGYDFFSYRAGLLANGSLDALAEYDRVIICNDSYVGPVRPYGRILDDMADKPFDVWGLTSSTRFSFHVQSFFVCFMPWVVSSHAFTQFWLRMTPLSDRWQVIKNYEIGMSKTLQEAGFSVGSYFTETPSDQRLGHKRMAWQALLRSSNSSISTRIRRVRREQADDWNPSIVMADRVLDDGRLPIVKIDTLRFDPYGLDSDRLLAQCESRFPDTFTGVRAYLEETAPFYPHRPNERLGEPDAPIKPLRRLVHYAGAR